MAMLVTEATLTPALWPSCARARFSSNRVMANQRSRGISLALFIAIKQFHDHTVERTEHRRDLDQMEPERLIPPEHLSGGDAEQKRVTDLPGGARHSDFNRSFHDAISHKQLAEQSRSMRLQLVINYD